MLDIRSKTVTIDDYSSLFAIFRDCSPLFALLKTIRTIHDYSPFAIHDYSLFAIRVFQTPGLKGCFPLKLPEGWMFSKLKMTETWQKQSFMK